VADRYNSFKELFAAEKEGYDYRIDVTSRTSETCILAPHGGGIEPGTSEIAAALAAGGKFSSYLFEGVKRTGNKGALHITSTNFDEPQCVGLLNKSKYAIALHGSDDDDDIIDIGGLNKRLMLQLKESMLQLAFKADIDNSGDHSGIDKRNICNRCICGQGVQIEFPIRVRSELFRDVHSREGRKETTEKFRQLISSLLSPLVQI
jgi:phage replication-related protein YjqB (UPF0714/DUF867 family)